MRFKPKTIKEIEMNKSLKAAATVAVTTLGFIAALPAQAFPSSAIEFSRQTYVPNTRPAQSVAVQTPRVPMATATTSAFPSAAKQD